MSCFWDSNVQFSAIRILRSPKNTRNAARVDHVRRRLVQELHQLEKSPRYLAMDFAPQEFLTHQDLRRALGEHASDHVNIQILTRSRQSHKHYSTISVFER